MASFDYGIEEKFSFDGHDFVLISMDKVAPHLSYALHGPVQSDGTVGPYLGELYVLTEEEPLRFRGTGAIGSAFHVSEDWRDALHPFLKDGIQQSRH